ncbi:hypothetical protein CXB51_025027 [Gossypium anomalum]|uniref:Fe2OG dioxygenase domain-containing protein n=1 Tax=Gossypium anomalum TaxID=47600 RepID=A0A8J5Y9B9_9ROSI|nr:hypothetical protein CXB51_025027 [Gossypium anomalum]
MIPDRYVKPLSDRPSSNRPENGDSNIPIIDLTGLTDDETELSRSTMDQISSACRDWGFFQVVNHGVSPGLMDQARETWRSFFHLPMEIKQAYANSPKTYEGYGSRLGIEKGAILDWSDYYYLHYLPLTLKDYNKWPGSPDCCREVIDEYGKELVKLGGRIMKVLSINLGLNESHLQNAFGGENIGACLRVNFYPKCPQPDLTLGLSSHSDPGGLTILLPDHEVPGLQVRKDGRWITVKPARHAFIVLSNANYKSVEHRVIGIIGIFLQPKSDIPIKPVKELVSADKPALYPPMTFDEYRLFIRLNGPKGKSQVEALKSPGCH